MLHRRIIDMITYTKQKGLRIRLVTNGTLLDSERIEAILRSGVDSGDRVIFSVLGYSKEVHERIMKGVDHTQVVNNIRNFLELRARHGKNGPVVETVFLTMLENKEERYQFYRYWRPVVDHVRVEDTISMQFRARDPESYGRILLTLTGVRGQKVIQLLDNKGIPVRQKLVSSDGLVEFDYLESAPFSLKIIHDRNGNGKCRSSDGRRN